MVIKSRADLPKAKRWVIKVGSSILLNPKGGFSKLFFRNFARQVAWFLKNNYRLAIVSSGAIAGGMQRLGIRKRPQQISKKQALAACGQTFLMHVYETEFSKFGIRVAQILLDKEDLSHRRRYLNARQAILELWRLGVVPIINENDTVAVDEIQVGDNDNLAALTTNLIEAQVLVILSDVEGVFTADPFTDARAKKISLIPNLTKTIHQFASGTKNARAVGGMITKLQAAQKAAHFGAATVITRGSGPSFLNDIFKKDVGTLILPRPAQSRLTTKKHWLAYSLSPRGKIVVDGGAHQALKKGGKSLLASGILRVEGHFDRGDCVEIKPAKGKIFAKGLSAYSSGEMEKIKGHHSGDIEKILGYKFLDEVIHRDDLVLL